MDVGIPNWKWNAEKSEVLEVEGRNINRKSIFDKHGAGHTKTNTRYDRQVNSINRNVPYTVDESITWVNYVTEQNNGINNEEEKK